MTFPIIIEYTYSEAAHNALASSIRPKHLISRRTIEQFIAKRAQNSPEFILSLKEISELLLLDGALFDSQKIRYYNDEYGAFIKIDEDFQIQISLKSMGTVKKLLLLISKQSRRTRAYLARISARIKRLEREFHETKSYLNSQEQRFSSSEVILEKNTPNLRNISNYSTPSLEIPSLDNAANRATQLARVRSSSGIEDYFELQKTTSSFSSDNTSHPLLLNLKKLDIAIMYAEPLAQILDSRTTITLPDAVDYEEECREIYENLQGKGIKLNLMIEIATRTNFVNVLTKNPVILHILCHGEHDKVKNRFYLCFEKSNGELDRLYAEDLKEILDKLKTKVQLVFVNACHSEPVATVFAEAGVPCVIGVQSQLQIADYFARKFAQGFYNYIFDGRTVGEAFNLALVSAGDPDSFSCCCAHAHKSDCKWLQKAKQEGYHHAHLYHEPLCTLCPRRNENIHRLNCEWAQDFQSNFCPDADTVCPARLTDQF